MISKKQNETTKNKKHKERDSRPLIDPTIGLIGLVIFSVTAVFVVLFATTK